MKPTWKDTSSYSYTVALKDRVPSEYTLEIPVRGITLRLLIHRYHLDQTQWFTTCYGAIDFVRVEVGAPGDSAEKAQAMALKLLKDIIETLAKQVSKL